MSRPRTPTKVLKIRGSFKTHPERLKEREDEPELPLGVGKPPEHFDAAQRECWDELAGLGSLWLTQADRPLLEEAAKLKAEGRRAKLSSPDGKRYDRQLADLGFGPVARTRVKVTKRADDQRKKLLA